MAMTTESREQVASELKRFAADLQLTEEQKEKLGTALAEGREKVGEYMKTHPTTTKAEIVAKVKEHRGEIHERIARFLNSEQLGKWDNEVAKPRNSSASGLTHKNPVPTTNEWPPGKLAATFKSGFHVYRLRVRFSSETSAEAHS